MILGHLTVTTCLHKGIEHFKVRLSFLPFLLGAMFPDLMDKPLSYMSVLPGRGLFHSTVVLGILFCLFKALFPGKRRLTFAFFAGALLHVILDIPIAAENAFWPLLGPFAYYQGPGLIDNIVNYYVGMKLPFHLAIEIISLPWFLTIIWKNRTKFFVFDLRFLRTKGRAA